MFHIIACVRKPVQQKQQQQKGVERTSIYIEQFISKQTLHSKYCGHLNHKYLLDDYVQSIKSRWNRFINKLILVVGVVY